MADPGSWDILDEDFEDISDWTDADNVNGVSQENPSGQLEFDTNTAASTNYAMRWRGSLTLNQDLTIQTKLKFDAIGTAGNADYWQVILYPTTSQMLRLDIDQYGDDPDRARVGVQGAAYTYSESVIPCNGDAAFVWLRVVLDYSELTCSVYYSPDGVTYTKLLENVDCNRTGTFTAGRCFLRQYGYTTNDRITHLDDFKVAAGLYIPTLFPVKTVNGLAWASVKTMNGQTHATTATINGLS